VPAPNVAIRTFMSESSTITIAPEVLNEQTRWKKLETAR
jgi:hypothetical protein